MGALALEYQEPRADYGLMQGLAQRTSGRAFPVAHLDSLPGLLARLPTFTPTIVAREAEQPGGGQDGRDGLVHDSLRCGGAARNGARASDPCRAGWPEGGRTGAAG